MCNQCGCGKGESKTKFLSRQLEKTKILSARDRTVFHMTEKQKDARIDSMIEAAIGSGLTLDEVYEMSETLDDTAFRQLMGRLSLSPMYRYSSVTPYRVRKAKAPSRPMR